MTNPIEHSPKIFKIPKINIEIPHTIKIVCGPSKPLPLLALGYNNFAIKNIIPSNTPSAAYMVTNFIYPISNYIFDKDIPDDMIKYEIEKIFDITINKIIEVDDWKSFSFDKLKKDMVLHIPSTFTMIYLHIVALLGNMFTEVYLYKPFYSEQHDLDSYLICKGFISKPFKIEYCEDGYPLYTSIHISIPSALIYANINLITSQQLVVNKILQIVKENNYYGDTFRNAREQCIKNLNWWYETMNNHEYINNIVQYALDRNETALQHVLY